MQYTLMFNNVKSTVELVLQSEVICIFPTVSITAIVLFTPEGLYIGNERILSVVNNDLFICYFLLEYGICDKKISF